MPPIRVFQQFATLDLISKCRIDLVVGRGSFTEAFPLFGLILGDYDTLFAEKLDLLLKIRDSAQVTWSGQHRPALPRLWWNRQEHTMRVGFDSFVSAVTDPKTERLVGPAERIEHLLEQIALATSTAVACPPAPDAPPPANG